MKIITAPHHSLRQKANPISKIDKKVSKFLAELETTLRNKKNPKGVGLAAPQVDTNLRAFAMDLSRDEKIQDINIYINPVITKHSFNKSLGENKKNPTLEGCLSIPNLYGPIPRWEWVEVEFDQITDGELQRTSEKFEWFPARVFQHELDHLNGILFTDYSLEFDLPLYRENEDKTKLIELDNYGVIETF